MSLHFGIKEQHPLIYAKAGDKKFSRLFEDATRQKDLWLLRWAAGNADYGKNEPGLI